MLKNSETRESEPNANTGHHNSNVDVTDFKSQTANSAESSSGLPLVCSAMTEKKEKEKY
jgi:hypothetical protein